MPDSPGIQYPTIPPEHQNLWDVFKNIFDNLFYLRGITPQKSTVGAKTITLAKITASGTDGSLSWSADGIITAYVEPT